MLEGYLLGVSYSFFFKKNRVTKYVEEDYFQSVFKQQTYSKGRVQKDLRNGKALNSKVHKKRTDYSPLFGSHDVCANRIPRYLLAYGSKSRCAIYVSDSICLRLDGLEVEFNFWPTRIAESQASIRIAGSV